MGNCTPEVSVLISAYRVSQYIAETLESVLCQRFSRAFELILVNDGSPDTSELEKAISPFRNRIIYHLQPNGGPSAARNTALQLSRAPLIALLDGDDMYLPHYLEVQCGMLEQEPDTVLVYGDMEVFGGSSIDGRLLSEVNRVTAAPSLETLLRTTATVLNTAMIRRDAIVAAGGWDETSRHAEDLDLWLRIAARGKIRRHSQTIARYRLRPDSLSSNYQKMLEGRLHAYKKVARDPDLTQELVALAQERVATTTGQIAVESGKSALRDTDSSRALAQFAEASKYTPSFKLSVIVLLLRVAPLFLQGLVYMRGILFARYRSI